MALNVITIQNKTVAPVEISMYVASDASGRSSVIWQKTYVLPNAYGLLEWNDTTDVALASFDAEMQVLTPYQLENADAGTRWSVALNEEGKPALTYSGKAGQPDQIEILNDSRVMVNAGIGVGGNGAIFKRDVLSNTSVVFNLQGMHYWITVTLLAVEGQLVPSTTMLADPVEIAFPPLLTAALVTVLQQGTDFELRVTYGGVAIAAKLM